MKRKVIALVTMSILSVAVTIATVLLFRESAEGQKRPSELPEIVSKIANIEVVHKKFKNLDESLGVIVLELSNVSSKGIVAVSAESGSSKETLINNFIAGTEGEFRLLAKPHSRFVIEVPMRNIVLGYPVRLSAVAYEDGRLEGEDEAVNELKGRVEKRYGRKIGGDTQ